MLIRYFLCVFFFKQKTAYEMRISDWSSDVCSSDLSQVLFGMSFAVGAGEVVTLMGRNGMGKTTTVATVMGLLRPTGGVVRIEGRAVQGLPPYRVAQCGLGLVPEGRQVFPTLTVAENLVATAAKRAGGAPRWTVETDRSEEHTSELQSLMRI